MTMHVLGQAAWMPGHPDVAAVLAGEPVEGADTPDLAGYSSRLMRGTSLVTRMSVAVARDALRAAGVQVGAIPAVFGSAYGEVTIAVDQLEMLVTGDRQISPMAFKNSVHNTSAGVFSIAHENRTSSTSIAASGSTVAYALLEAQCMLDEGAPHVLCVVADEALPMPISLLSSWTSFAAAWVLARAPGSGAGVSLSEPVMQAVREPELPSAVAEHPCRGALPLLGAIAARRPGAVWIGATGAEVWSIEVGPRAQEGSS